MPDPGHDCLSRPGASLLHAGSKAVSNNSLASPARAKSAAPRASSPRTTFQRRKSPSPTSSRPASAIASSTPSISQTDCQFQRAWCQFRECVNVVWDRLGAFRTDHLCTGLSSPSRATPQVAALASRQAGKPGFRGHRALDHEQVPSVSAAQPGRPPGPLPSQLARPFGSLGASDKHQPHGRRRRVAQRACKQGKRLLRSVVGHERFDGPERVPSEESQLGKTRIAIDQKSGEQSNKALVLCHHNQT